jgi:hypothetical protein
MFRCDQLYHPALNDPGTSQDQRLPAVLGDDIPAIDAREISDLLNYFADLSHQINYYDSQLAVSDWGPFFEGDLPFFLSKLATFNSDAANSTIGAYTKLFNRRPAADGLRLLFLYTWYSVIDPIRQCADRLQDTGLPLEQTLQTLIRDRLPVPIKQFIIQLNTAIKCFCLPLKSIDMSILLENDAWGLSESDLTAYDETFSCTGRSRRSQLMAMQSTLSGLLGAFTEVMNLAGDGASDLVNKDLYTLLQVSGQQDVRPHLALLYSFLSQYLFALDDLNNLTEKHLSFFFQNVLQLSPGDVIPDQAFVVFGLQKQVPRYPLPAGLSLKDGKDAKNADVYFALAEPVLVTQAQTASLRTLFLNVKTAGGASWLEGVYMAPDATMADGQTQAFPDAATASWPTLGASISKYTPPRAQGPLPYPQARLGFVLASKIFFLKEGERKVHIRLNCQWKDPCSDTSAFNAAVTQVFADAFQKKWIIVTQDLIDQAASMGLGADAVQKLKDHYLKDNACHPPICADDKQTVYRNVIVIPYQKHDDRLEEEHVTRVKGLRMADFEEDLWLHLLKPQGVLDLAFSGEKAWIIPKDSWMYMEIPDDSGNIILNLHARLGKDQDAVTFYNKTALGEDLGTADPLVRVLLNDTVKVALADYKNAAGEASHPDDAAAPCCLMQPSVPDDCPDGVSFYEFLRNLVVLEEGTGVHVTVCGVKTLIVQNDQNLLDIKKPFAPFGVKPVVPDFDIRSRFHPASQANLIGPNFYIGNVEVFLKKWDRISVNLNWQGKPSSLHRYYRAYIRWPLTWTSEHFPRHQVNLALLHNGNWTREVGGTNAYTHLNHITGHHNRHFFDNREDRIERCHDRRDYEYSYDIRPPDFDMDGNKLQYDPLFAPLSDYHDGVLNGFLRLTMENQDFLHKLYPTLLAEKIMDRATARGRPVLMPNEPWTPTILNLSLDYEATAFAKDLQLIQLYPYTGTYSKTDLTAEPTLLATFCDEGNLFIGISGLVPGDSLNILFQLAEATAETESGGETITWQYLAKNEWRDLRQDYEVTEDQTNGLSTTGIVQFDFPDDISNNNSKMPPDLCWIKASAGGNAQSTSQTMAVITQAALARFVNNPQLNDQARPATPLKKGSITKLTAPDQNVTSVSQPYDSFGGQAPEIYGNVFNQRVCEYLRHKGRAVQKWDYERIVLQQFPKILRAKCITHSYALDSSSYRWDFPMAPGNVLLAVLPDPAQLAVTDSLQPTVPMSLLTGIEEFVGDRVSPFVRVFARNPRYEPIDMCLKVSLRPNMNPIYYQTQLQEDIRGFMAPWLQGDTDSFQFGQPLYSSDLVRFIENLSYIDSVHQLEMCHQGNDMETRPDRIDPMTPRSILVAGKIVVNIDKPKTANGGKQ